MDVPQETPLEDLRESAIRNYEEGAKAIHSWDSSIPKAINFYFDHQGREVERKANFKGWVKFMLLLYLVIFLITIAIGLAYRAGWFA